MFPITWLFCLALLWSIVVDTQVNAMDPWVLAVYSSKYDQKRIILADLANAKDEDFKLPLDDEKPKYFVLLCGRYDRYTENWKLIVQLVTKEIDSKAKIKCDNYPLPYIRIQSSTPLSLFAYTGYVIIDESWKQENKSTTNNQLLKEFKEEFDLKRMGDFYLVKYLDYIQYNYINNIPEVIMHDVIAHMHFNNYEKKCDEIRLDKFIEESVEYKLDILHRIQVPGFQWRQLVPMQDFQDINETNATCIYLNYLMLHEKAIESLKTIEIFIRNVADVINKVRVQTGTYTPKDEVLLEGDKLHKTMIPAVVWKKITHRCDSEEFYSVVVVIHNKQTERVCEHNEDIENLGLPAYNYDKNEIDIGDMYYCLINQEIKKRLKINPDEIHYNNDEKLLNFNKLPIMKDGETKEINVIERIKKNEQARSEKSYASAFSSYAVAV